MPEEKVTLGGGIVTPDPPTESPVVFQNEHPLFERFTSPDVIGGANTGNTEWFSEQQYQEPSRVLSYDNTPEREYFTYEPIVKNNIYDTIEAAKDSQIAEEAFSFNIGEDKVMGGAQLGQLAGAGIKDKDNNIYTTSPIDTIPPVGGSFVIPQPTNVITKANEDQAKLLQDGDFEIKNGRLGVSGIDKNLIFSDEKNKNLIEDKDIQSLQKNPNTALFDASDYTGISDKITGVSNGLEEVLNNFAKETVEKYGNTLSIGNVPIEDIISKEVANKGYEYMYDKYKELGLLPEIDVKDAKLKELLQSSKYILGSQPDKIAYLANYANRNNIESTQFVKENSSYVYPSLDAIFTKADAIDKLEKLDLEPVLGDEKIDTIKNGSYIYTQITRDTIGTTRKTNEEADFSPSEFGDFKKAGSLKKFNNDKAMLAHTKANYQRIVDYDWMKETSFFTAMKEGFADDGGYKKSLPFSGAVDSYWKNTNIKYLINKKELGLKLSDTEEAFIKSEGLYNHFSDIFPTNKGYTVGHDGIPQMIDYMVTFAATGGIYSATKAGVETALKAGLEVGSASLAQKIVATQVIKTFAIQGFEKWAVPAISSFAGFTAQASIGSFPNIVADAVKQLTPTNTYYFDNNTYRYYDEIEKATTSPLEAATRAWLGQVVEFGTERLGYVFETKAAQAFKGKVFDYLYKGVGLDKLNKARLASLMHMTEGQLDRVAGVFSKSREYLGRVLLGDMSSKYKALIPNAENFANKSLISKIFNATGTNNLLAENFEEFVSNRLQPFVYAYEDKFWNKPIKTVRDEAITTTATMLPLFGAATSHNILGKITGRFTNTKERKILNLAQQAVLNYTSDEFEKHSQVVSRTVNKELRGNKDALNSINGLFDIRKRWEAEELGNKKSGQTFREYAKERQSQESLLTKVQIAFNGSERITPEKYSEISKDITDKDVRQSSDRIFSFYNTYRDNVYNNPQEREKYSTFYTFVKKIDTEFKRMDELLFRAIAYKKVIGIEGIKKRIDNFKYYSKEQRAILNKQYEAFQKSHENSLSAVYRDPETHDINGVSFDFGTVNFTKNPDGTYKYNILGKDDTNKAEREIDVIESLQKDSRNGRIPDAVLSSISEIINKSDLSLASKEVILDFLYKDAINSLSELQELNSSNIDDFYREMNIILPFINNGLIEKEDDIKAFFSLIKRLIQVGVSKDTSLAIQAADIISNIYMSIENEKIFSIDEFVELVKSIAPDKVKARGKVRKPYANKRTIDQIEKAINEVKFEGSLKWKELVAKNSSVASLDSKLTMIMNDGVISKKTRDFIRNIVMLLPESLLNFEINFDETTEDAYVERLANGRLTITIGTKDTKASTSNEKYVVYDIVEEIVHSIDFNLGKSLALSMMSEEETEAIVGKDGKKILKIIKQFYNSKTYKYSQYEADKAKSRKELTKEQKEFLTGLDKFLKHFRKKFKSSGRIAYNGIDIEYSERVIIENYGRIKMFMDNGYTEEQSFYYAQSQHEFFARQLADFLILGDKALTGYGYSKVDAIYIVFDRIRTWLMKNAIAPVFRMFIRNRDMFSQTEGTVENKIKSKLLQDLGYSEDQLKVLQNLYNTLASYISEDVDASTTAYNNVVTNVKVNSMRGNTWSDAMENYPTVKKMDAVLDVMIKANKIDVQTKEFLKDVVIRNFNLDMLYVRDFTILENRVSDYAGFYSPASNTVTLNFKIIRDSSYFKNASVFLHELSHAYEYNINNYIAILADSMYDFDNPIIIGGDRVLPSASSIFNKEEIKNLKNISPSSVILDMVRNLPEVEFNALFSTTVNEEYNVESYIDSILKEHFNVNLDKTHKNKVVVFLRYLMISRNFLTDKTPSFNELYQNAYYVTDIHEMFAEAFAVASQINSTIAIRNNKIASSFIERNLDKNTYYSVNGILKSIDFQDYHNFVSEQVNNIGIEQVHSTVGTRIIPFTGNEVSDYFERLYSEQANKIGYYANLINRNELNSLHEISLDTRIDSFINFVDFVDFLEMTTSYSDANEGHVYGLYTQYLLSDSTQISKIKSKFETFLLSNRLPIEVSDKTITDFNKDIKGIKNRNLKAFLREAYTRYSFVATEYKDISKSKVNVIDSIENGFLVNGYFDYKGIKKNKSLIITETFVPIVRANKFTVGLLSEENSFFGMFTDENMFEIEDGRFLSTNYSMLALENLVDFNKQESPVDDIILNDIYFTTQEGVEDYLPITEIAKDIVTPSVSSYSETTRHRFNSMKGETYDIKFDKKDLEAYREAAIIYLKDIKNDKSVLAWGGMETIKSIPFKYIKKEKGLFKKPVVEEGRMTTGIYEEPKKEGKVFIDPLKSAQKLVVDDERNAYLDLKFQLQDYLTNAFGRPIQFIKKPLLLEMLDQVDIPEIQEVLKYIYLIKREYDSIKYASRADVARMGLSLDEHKKLYQDYTIAVDNKIIDFLNTVKDFEQKIALRLNSFSNRSEFNGNTDKKVFTYTLKEGYEVSPEASTILASINNATSKKDLIAQAYSLYFGAYFPYMGANKFKSAIAELVESSFDYEINEDNKVWKEDDILGASRLWSIHDFLLNTGVPKNTAYGIVMSLPFNEVSGIGLSLTVKDMYPRLKSILQSSHAASLAMAYAGVELVKEGEDVINLKNPTIRSFSMKNKYGVDISSFYTLLKTAKQNGTVIDNIEVKRILTELSTNPDTAGNFQQYALSTIEAWKAYYAETNINHKQVLSNRELKNLLKTEPMATLEDYLDEVEFIENILNKSEFRSLVIDVQSAKRAARQRYNSNYQNDIRFYIALKKLSSVNPKYFTSKELVKIKEMLGYTHSSVPLIEDFINDVEDYYNVYIERLSRQTLSRQKLYDPLNPDTVQKKLIYNRFIDNVKLILQNGTIDEDTMDFLSVNTNLFEVAELEEYIAHLKYIIKQGGINHAIFAYTAQKQAEQVYNDFSEFYSEASVKLFNKKAKRGVRDFFSLHGSINAFGLADAVEFIENDMSGGQHILLKALVEPLDKNYDAQRKTLYQIMKEISPRAPLNKKVYLNIAGIYSLLTQSPESMKLTLGSAKYLVDELGFVEEEVAPLVGLTIMYNTTEDLEMRIFDALRKRILLSIKDSLFLSFLQTNDVITEDMIEEARDDMFGASMRTKKDALNEFAEMEEKIRPLFGDRDTWFDEFLTGIINTQDMNIGVEHEGEIKEYVQRLRDVFNRIKDGSFTGTPSLDYITNNYIGDHQFVNIINYMPILRYKEYNDVDFTIDTLDPSQPLTGQLRDMTGLYYNIGDRVSTNNSFTQVRKQVVMALQTDIFEMTRVRADQELFMMLNQKQMMKTKALFNTPLFNQVEDQFPLFNKDAKKWLSNQLIDYFNRGRSKGKTELRQSKRKLLSLGRLTQVMSGLRILTLGSIFKAPSQLASSLNSLQTMNGNIGERMLDLMNAIKMVSTDTEGNLDKFILDYAPDVYFRNIVDYNLDKVNQTTRITFADLFKDYGNTKDKWTDLQMFGLVFFDRMAAKISFVANYLNYLRVNNLTFDYANPIMSGVDHSARSVKDTQGTENPLYRSATIKNTAVRPLGLDINTNSQMGEFINQSYWAFKSFSIFDIKRLRKARAKVYNGLAEMIDGNMELGSNLFFSGVTELMINFMAKLGFAYMRALGEAIPIYLAGKLVDADGDDADDYMKMHMSLENNIIRSFFDYFVMIEPIQFAFRQLAEKTEKNELPFIETNFDYDSPEDDMKYTPQEIATLGMFQMWMESASTTAQRAQKAASGEGDTQYVDLLLAGTFFGASAFGVAPPMSETYSVLKHMRAQVEAPNPSSDYPNKSIDKPINKGL
jgi:hypothetical protein